MTSFDKMPIKKKNNWSKKNPTKSLAYPKIWKTSKILSSNTIFQDNSKNVNRQTETETINELPTNEYLKTFWWNIWGLK